MQREMPVTRRSERHLIKDARGPLYLRRQLSKNHVTAQME